MVDFRILSEDDKKLIHEKSLEILEQAGIRLESDKLLTMLKSKGCFVDDDEKIVKFPASLVEDAIKSAPKEFILGGLDPENDMFLGVGNSYVATDGQACFMYDAEKGERRETVLKDLVDAARLVDDLDYIQCFWPIVSAGDVPDETRTIRELVEGLRVTGKHFQTDCFSEEQAKYYIKVLEEILGSREKVIERKIFSVVCCPVSPLIFEAEMTEGCCALGEIEVPVVVLPMPISGTTAPMSVFGTVIQNNAEVLAGLTILQLNKAGVPVIYGSAEGILDMKTTLFCVGSPEGSLQNAASCEMAKYYSLPSLSSCNCTEAKEPDIQCGREKFSTLLPVAMARPDIVCGVGLVDTSNYYFPELLVLDEDSVGYAMRISDGIKGGEENALTDAVIDVGPSGSFLAEKSTRAYLRNGEHYRPVATHRQSYETWLDAQDGDVCSTARNKVKEMLDKPAKEYLSDEKMIRLKEILAEAEREMS